MGIKLSRTAYCQLKRLAAAPIRAEYDAAGMKELLNWQMVKRERESDRFGAKYNFTITERGQARLAEQPEAPELKLSDTGARLIQYILKQDNALLVGTYHLEAPGNASTRERLLVDGALALSDQAMAYNPIWKITDEGLAAFKRTAVGREFFQNTSQQERRNHLSTAFALAYTGPKDDVFFLSAKADYLEALGEEDAYAAEVRHEADAAAARVDYRRLYCGDNSAQPLEIKLYPNNTLCGLRFEYGIQVGIQDGIWHVWSMAIRNPTVMLPQEKTEFARSVAMTLLAATKVVDRLNGNPPH